MKSRKLLQILSTGFGLLLLLAGCLAQGPAVPTLVSPTQAATTAAPTVTVVTAVTTVTAAPTTAVPTILAPTLTPTPTPAIITTPASTFTGSVSIEGGKCCAGGTAGSTIQVSAAFSAASPASPVRQMRVLPAYGGCANSPNIDTASWEPFAPSKSYPVAVAINWNTFNLSAQFKDEQGNLSPVYCAEIAIEGAPPPPVSTNLTAWYPQVQCFAETEVHPAQGETITGSPVTFSWPNKNTLPEGVFYKVFAFGSGDSYTATVATGQTRETALALPIPPDRAGDIVWYVVLVDANGTFLDHGNCSTFSASLLKVDPPSGIKGVHFMFKP